MGEGSVVIARMIKVAVEAPWWKTILVGLGLALLSLAGPRVLGVLGREENVLLNVLAALWWVPLLLLGFLSAIAFLQKAKWRWRRTKQRNAESGRRVEPIFNSGRRS